MPELENNFSISLNKGECKLKISGDWITLNRGTTYGDQELYSMSDERGIIYRIFYNKPKREFEDLHIDDPTYQGIGRQKVTIPRDRQFIQRMAI